MRTQPGDKLFRFCIQVTFARHDPYHATRTRNVNRYPHALQFTKSAYTTTAHISRIQRRREHYPQYRPALLNQRNIDGKLTITRDKLFCSIQRVNQPETRMEMPDLL